MLQLLPQLRILIGVEPVDFRRGLDSLIALCRKQYSQDPFSGSLYVFRNRPGTAIKMICYDGTGFYLTQERQKAKTANQIGGSNVTITDLGHPLFGRTFRVIRTYNSQSKLKLVIELEDGRFRRIPASITDLAHQPSEVDADVASANLISVRILLPLSQLICAMVSSREDDNHDANSQTSINGPLRADSRLNSNATASQLTLELPGYQHSASVDSMPGRINSACTKLRRAGKKGSGR